VDEDSEATFNNWQQGTGMRIFQDVAQLSYQ
jgi:hypothetical protein